MKALVKALEWLRPLVETKAWDYCVVWKYGDDPSRYIEWIGCCCSGSYGDCKNVKEETDATDQHFPAMCKDTYVKHSVRTKACEKLAKFPSSWPLYSGETRIHGEVAASNKASWLVNELAGTEVLIPLVGGMVEIFSAKNVPEDRMLIDTFMAQFSMFVEHEQAATEVPEHPKPGLNSFLCHNITRTLLLFSPDPQPITHPNVKGSPTGSNLRSEQSSLISSSTHVSPTRSIGKPNNMLGASNSMVVKEKPKAKQRSAKEQYQSKNLVTERNRRNRIKDGLFALRALVPKISKMDRLSIVGDAIEYIEELQDKVKELQEELQKLEEEDYKSNEAEFEVCKPKRAYEAVIQSPTKAHNEVPSIADKQTEAQLEVYQIGATEYLLKFICSKKRGSFLRIMEALNSMGLLVVDANVTTCDGIVLNILRVEAKGVEVAAESLKDCFLTKWLSHTVDRS